MTLVVQNHKTELYLHRNGEWTEDVSAAAEFPSSALALAHVLNARAHDAQIVLRSDERRCDVVQPVFAVRDHLAASTFSPSHQHGNN